MDDAYCDECADWECTGNLPCAYCDGPICNECNGCSCPNTPCPGIHPA